MGGGDRGDGEKVNVFSSCSLGLVLVLVLYESLLQSSYNPLWLIFFVLFLLPPTPHPAPASRSSRVLIATPRSDHRCTPR